MNLDDYQRSLEGMGHVATASGLSDHQQAFALMLTACALADRGMPLGCSREDFLHLAGIVHDRVRKALAGGRQAW